MKKVKFLLPHWCLRVGWCMLVPLLVGGVLLMTTDALEFLSFTWNDVRQWFGAEPLPVEPNKFSDFDGGCDLFPSLLGVLLVVSGMMVGFSREAIEDEFTEHIRYESLAISIWIFALMVLLGLVFIWGVEFLHFSIWAMFVWLLVYIVVLHTRLWAAKRRVRHEE